uniref:GNAT family N-acetyltransferase n=1 Tax=Kitasatospora indigofera TaxID=67307 RepID=UPI002F90CA41
MLELIGADRLPGRPAPTAGALAQALAGLDADGHPQVEGIAHPVTDLLLDARNRPAGIISCALRPGDRSALVLWAHAREHFETMAVLLAWARARLGPRRTWYAFAGAPATGPTTEGLPAGHRPATTRALLTAGFTPLAQRHHWHHTPTYPLLPPATCTGPQAEITAAQDNAGWHLRLTDTHGTPLAQARLDTPHDGTAHLRHLTVDPAHRGQGLGRRLLDQCLHHALRCGATAVTAVTDTDAVQSEAPAHRLLSRAGFVPVDTFTVYRRV